MNSPPQNRFCKIIGLLKVGYNMIKIVWGTPLT